MVEEEEKNRSDPTYVLPDDRGFGIRHGSAEHKPIVRSNGQQRPRRLVSKVLTSVICGKSDAHTGAYSMWPSLLSG